ncbi:histone-lysine N-methyltransferase G9a [Aphomia sociella]
MHENESEVAVTTKKKLDKNQPAESSNLVVTVDKIDLKKAEKSDGDEPKPRIVLTFRSEKSGTKSSNMKIVSNEDKNEEFSPRRSSRTRSKWEWTEEHESVSPKKDKSISQSVSENDEASDSSHTTPKRSTRRRSKDSSDNVLANAIARKEKSYNETSGPTQRLSRRIKPTAKVLENEELRIGLESQNNARLGLQTEKHDEGVRTRRSAKPTVSEKAQSSEKKDKRSKTEKMEIENTNDKKQNEISVMKLKHLCELGLQAINPESAEDEDEENEVEGMDDEEEEIDDDSEVISKLLEADEDTASESSDEEFYCSAETSETERPRRSNRLSSTYGANDSDRSSPVGHGDEDKVPPRRSSRRTTKHYVDDSDRAYKPKRKKNRASRGEEPPSEPEQEDNSNPAGGDEGSEAVCPEEESTVVATCYCEKPSNVYAAPEDLIEPVFCQAIEMVDGVRVGCSRAARRGATGELAALGRAGPRAPYVLACTTHAAQLRAHMCCPACGLYCTQGIFYQCSEGHLFHLECGLPYNDTKLRTGCPHCGVFSYRWQPVNHECIKVRVQMHSSNKTIFLPDQREQCTPAYLGFSTQEPLKVDEEPLIPEDLLPSSLEELKSLSEKREGTDYEEMLSASDAQSLCDAILAGETVELLMPKIVACADVDEHLSSVEGGTCSHAAARAGRSAALALLRAAGANLDAVDNAGRTPLLIAIKELVEKDNKDTKTPKNTENETVEMEVDGDKEDVKENNDTDDKQETETKEEEKECENLKASDEEFLKVIRYLIAAGCDVNFPGPERMSALHVCAQYGGNAGAAGARALLAAPQIRVDERDAGGWTPLVWAAEHSHPELVRLLLSAGADATSADNEGNAAVHWCALGGHPDALLQLLSAAPHCIDVGNAHADTPLHVAARQGHYACVVILLARGARTDITNCAGELAAQVCVGRCRTAVSLSMHMRAAHSPPPRLLSNDISRGREYHPVPCVNEVDDEPLPDFKYVTRHVMPENVTVDCSISTMQGCTCTDACRGGECACCALSVRAWYDTRGRLSQGFPYHDPPMLFECNHTCGCDVKQCGNSVVTKLSERRGWGLRVRQSVSRGAAVATYCGELLPLPAADTRSADHYMFALDVKPDLLEQCAEKGVLCVDALQYGSAARFINHSCRPNLAPVRVYAATRDLRLPVVALFATRDIRAHEELTFDYGDKFWSVKSKWMRCECGAPDCRYPEKLSEDSET